MYRSLVAIMAIALTGLVSPAQTTTPNLGLSLPSHGSSGWDSAINQDFSLIDTAMGSTVQKTVTINGHALSANITLGFPDFAAGALANGTTATTQTNGDSTTKLATDAFVQAAIAGISSGGSGGSMTWPATAGIAVYSGSGAWGTSLTAPAGALVGTTDTQTLTNKTIDGVSPTSMGYMDATSSIQTQLNGKQASLGFTPVPNTTTVNGHALSGNVTVSASDITTGTLPHAQLPALQSADIPANAANTTGSAGSLSAASALPNGTTATTQITGDSSTKLATDAFVATAISAQPKPTYSKVVTYELPAQGDIIPMLDLPNGVTIKRVFCSIKDGTNVVFNLYATSESNPWTTSGGTAVFSADQTCTTSGLTATSFTSPSVGAHVPLAVSVTSESGNPSFVDFTVEYQ